MQALIPASAKGLSGPFLTVGEDTFEVKGTRNKSVVLAFHALPEGIDWFKPFELMFCQRQHDPETVKVIRAATDEEQKLFRIPVWIQDDEVPACCGKPMHFVGQIDDDRLCTERPKGAKRWWHDAASFYVFTCDQCLGCQSVGQQF